jgi:hypothetical protein
VHALHPPGACSPVRYGSEASTLLHFHSVLRKRKYRILFSPKRPCRPGPKGPDKGFIDAVVVMKRRNPNWGCPRLAQQISLAFGVEIDKDVVRRLLSVHYRPDSASGGSSWLTFSLGRASLPSHGKTGIESVYKKRRSFNARPYFDYHALAELRTAPTESSQ